MCYGKRWAQGLPTPPSCPTSVIVLPLSNSYKWRVVTGVHCQCSWFPFSRVSRKKEHWHSELLEAELQMRKCQPGITSSLKITACSMFDITAWASISSFEECNGDGCLLQIWGWHEMMSKMLLALRKTGSVCCQPSSPLSAQNVTGHTPGPCGQWLSLLDPARLLTHLIIFRVWRKVENASLLCSAFLRPTVSGGIWG